MATLDFRTVENKMAKAIDDARKILKIDDTVNSDYCPGEVIPSQVLVTLIRRLGRALDVNIPDSCYLFHDKKTNKYLSIKEAAQKLIKVAKNEK